MRQKSGRVQDGRIMRVDELSFEIRLERRTTKGSSSGRIMHPSCARLHAKDA